MNTTDSAFGSVLKDVRQAHSLSQRRLATLLGISNMTLSRWEMGAAIPRLGRLPEIARVLNVSARRLLDAIVEDVEAA